MVKPGGTGSPMRHISARLAPLPPSSGFIVPLPSVLRPNRYTNFPRAAFAPFCFVFPVAFFAILSPGPRRHADTEIHQLPCLRVSAAALALRHNFRNICDIKNEIPERRHEPQPRRAQ